MTDQQSLLRDLTAEGDEVLRLVGELDEPGWATPTPAPGWTIAHQIAHLTWTDQASLRAVTDPDDFADLVTELADTGDLLRAIEAGAAELAALPPDRLRDGWVAGRRALADALGAVPPGARIAWFGPSMSAASMITARIMENWAHGLDIADALGVRREPTDRLRHVAHLGVRARDFAYVMHGRTAPSEPFRVELTGPGGDLWTWGPDDAVQRVTGPALDFCLLATQRRHRDDLAVTAEGADADEWLDIIQAFAGPPGAGRTAGQFA
ncbi:uncharacterized protein (TIGR03084 family) [Allocatelliglobosispora scoriae]|uniref:Uncharacterized protein (TIGR03084 family) n=1 Tax=Allocatelliglobosispora scoriae TaxID=643052 RepID=A0A841BYN8_9ACTN|nr:TIGR03084 family metal-binding protein [Allocatelliglobosispora scoriae]MBB5873254.1 uncharacterized protein (TIGR03084 family) [Allocatelliglobosispora scoriae]